MAKLTAAVAALAFMLGTIVGPGAASADDQAGDSSFVITPSYHETRTSCDKGVEQRTVTESVLVTYAPGGSVFWSVPKVFSRSPWVQVTLLSPREASRLACAEVPKLRAKIKRLQQALAQQRH